MNPQNAQAYHSYLVRLWHEDEDEWRVILENVHTGERCAFGDLEALFAFMRQETKPEQQHEMK